MSNDKQYIDEFLKENLEHFAPDAPNVWQQVHTQVQNAAQATSAATVKTALSLLAKTAIISASIASVALVTYFVINSNQEAIQVVAEQQPQPALQPQTEVEIVSAPKTIEELPQTKATKTKAQQKPVEVVEIKEDKQANAEQVLFTEKQIGGNEGKANIATQSMPSNSIIPLINENQKVVVTENQPKPAAKQSEQEKRQETKSEVSGKSNIERIDPSMPNVFSPNGDGGNDTYIIDIENEILYQLTIRDKEGKVMFQSINKNEHWDGTDQNTGKQCEDAIYVAELLYQLKGDAEPTAKPKLVTIKRKN